MRILRGILSLSIVTLAMGCTTGDKDYIRNHIVQVPVNEPSVTGAPAELTPAIPAGRQ